MTKPHTWILLFSSILNANKEINGNSLRIPISTKGTTTEFEKTSEVTKYGIIIPDVLPDTTTELGEVSINDDPHLKNVSSFDITIGRINSSDYFQSCGDLFDKCPVTNVIRPHRWSKEEETTTIKSSERKSMTNSDYRNAPHYCRCDKETCKLYGDCCWTIATTAVYNNPWRCQRLKDENDPWALMISTCPLNSTPGLKKSCESPEDLSAKSYTYLHDLPVVRKADGHFYKNVYCAICNGVAQTEIQSLNIHMKCNQQFNATEEQKEFIARAVYQPGKRLWTEETTNSTCGVYVIEFDPKPLLLYFPNVRFCKKGVVESCPEKFTRDNPFETALCQSYTQIVTDRKSRRLFKNQHCAKCHGLEDSSEWKCHVPTSEITDPIHVLRTSPGSSNSNLDSIGLSLMFDFDLDFDNNYVGYDSRCPEDSIWDFLRQRCTVTMCAKAYELDLFDGTCKPEGMNASNLEGQMNQNDSLIGKNENDTSLEEVGNNNSTCYILIFHESEYILLANNSILINRSGTNETLIFEPSEYSTWNESSLYICARELSEQFQNRFSPILNYISVAALGISVFFSILHSLIFVLLPKMRNLPGKNLFCLTLSLLISQGTFLGFISHTVKEICILASIIMHYFFLSSFFWMNVMSFDIWRTFSGEFMTRHQSSSGSKLFLKYSLYAWGTPALILILSISIEFYFADLFRGYEIMRTFRPLYGHNNLCWFGQRRALFAFFALPAVIIIGLNILLFTCTTKAILEQSRDAKKVFSPQAGQGKSKVKTTGELEMENSRKSEAEVDRMKLYGKLGLIMGVTWILGFLSGASDDSNGSEWEWLWYPFVVLNGLQGTFIFFAFDVKVKVWEMLKEKLGKDCVPNGASKLRKGTEGNTTTTTMYRRGTTTSTMTSSSAAIHRNSHHAESISQKIPV